jgi:hypothetical protein
MKAFLGDRVFVDSGRAGHERSGRIVELRHHDGTPPYVVRWDDTGREEVHFPRGDGRIERPVGPRSGGAVEHWSRDIDLLSDGTRTTAVAVLHDGASGVVTGDGTAVRHDGERDDPAVGDSLAAARALTDVSNVLLEDALDSVGGIPESSTPSDQ